MVTFDKQSDKSRLTNQIIELVKKMSEHEQRTLLKDLEESLFRGKREHIRKPFSMVVDYSTEDRAYKDFIQDISAGGVFIETHMPFSVGQQVSLSFPLPDYQKHVKITGEIVRSSPEGLAVKFKMVNQAQEAMIKSLLEMI